MGKEKIEFSGGQYKRIKVRADSHGMSVKGYLMTRCGGLRWYLSNGTIKDPTPLEEFGNEEVGNG